MLERNSNTAECYETSTKRLDTVTKSVFYYYYFRGGKIKKSKSSQLRRHMQQTGVVEAVKDLTVREQQVLNVIGSVSVSGYPKTPTFLLKI